MRSLLFIVGLLCLNTTCAQDFTAQDTLRGSITPERAWWDVQHYELDVSVNPENKFISGSTTMTYLVISDSRKMQIDLQPPMKLTKVVQNNKELNIEHNGNAHFIQLHNKQELQQEYTITFYFEGHPKEAVRAPWDGGFSWKKDSDGIDFIATSCQGLGASVWWPNKDHSYDEPNNGIDISVTVPKKLTAVANGRLLGTTENNTTTTFHWQVVNPINNYGVNINIGNYMHFGETYNGLKGVLDMDYWVLKQNETKARAQFKDATRMMEAFEYWFGPYPFYEDSFKLVEVPYLGMEHQSSVTYGNQFKNGYLGTDLSDSGWGLKFDFIIIHESGHEWFANNITFIDAADMWVHEGFTAYSESLFVDYFYGTAAANAYVQGVRKRILNDSPIIGTYGVNAPGSGDMYYKGSNMLHTLRQLVDDDTLWRNILNGLNKEFYHQTVSSAQVEAYISKKTNKNLTAFFNQYLRTTNIPTLEYTVQNNEVWVKYSDTVPNFDMPLKILLGDESKWVYPTQTWKNSGISTTQNSIAIDPNFYVNLVQKTAIKID